MNTSSDIADIVLFATNTAKQLNSEYVTVEHILLGVLNSNEFNTVLVEFGADVTALTKDLTGWCVAHPTVGSSTPKKTYSTERVFNRAFAQAVFDGREHLRVVDIFDSIYFETNSHAVHFLCKHGVTRAEFVEFYRGKFNNGSTKNKILTPEQADSILAEHCVNLNTDAEAGKIDPLIGREAELAEIVDVLAKRNKRNILLVGDPGTGKTALAEGLALHIVNDNVPEYLKGHIVYNLDVGQVLAGCKYRGDFESKIKNIMKALTDKGNCVLFIDEAHQIRGAGSVADRGVDFANMIKPAIAKGKVKIIASTTWEEYAQSFENDRALMRRFYRLSINEPSPAVAKEILAGLKGVFETFHGGLIDNSAIAAAVDLSVKYLVDKRLPDKAIDLIDTAAAQLKIRSSGSFVVTEEHIISVVSTIAKIPKEQVGGKSDTGKKLGDLEQNILATLYGQNHVVTDVLDKIYVAHAGMKSSNKPIGSFLFIGPTGTGKTELAKLLCKNLDMHLIRFDCSELMERHSIATLIGAPPGYVGYKDGGAGSGLLISEVEKHPHCVILFDEIEKAHPDVSNLLLQLMDEGCVTASNGKKADCRSAIIIMTSNLGASDNEKNTIGFGRTLDKTGEDDTAVKNFFKPEFRNRLDAICKFNKLDEPARRLVVSKFMQEVSASVTSKGITLAASNAFVEYLVDAEVDSTMGARSLGRKIDELVKVPLAKKIVFEKIASGTTVTINYKSGKVAFALSKRKTKITV